MNLLQDYIERGVTSGRARMLRLDTVTRYAVTVVTFHPTNPPYYGVRFNPRHSLSIPRPLPDCELDEVHYSKGEQLLYDRTDLLAFLSSENAKTLAAMKEPAKDYCWLVGIELGLSATAYHFASVDWKNKSFDINNLRFEVIRPTAAEVAKWAERGAA